VRIETEAACRTAVAAAGKTAGSPFLETRSSYPRGCYSLFSEAFFNRHTVGAGYLMAQLLCAAVTTGAPPGADARVDVCAADACGSVSHHSALFRTGCHVT
jgi:hypothetical protein